MGNAALGDRPNCLKKETINRDPSSLCKSAVEVKHPHLENTDTDFDNVILTGLRCSAVLMFSLSFFYVAWSILVSCSYLVNVLSQ